MSAGQSRLKEKESADGHREILTRPQLLPEQGQHTSSVSGHIARIFSPVGHGLCGICSTRHHVKGQQVNK